MTDDRDQPINLDDTAGADNRAAAAEAAEAARDDALADDEAAMNEITTPRSAPIAQPDPLPPDGVR